MIESMDKSRLPQERLVEASVDRDDLAGGFAEAFRDKEEISFRLVGRSDRALCERAIGIELGELVHQ